MLPKQAKYLISCHVNRRIRGYHDLEPNDQRELVSTIITHLEPYDKASLLCDYDHDSILPQMIADIIGGRPDAISRFFDAIWNIFVAGKKTMPFLHAIEDCFDEEWCDQWANESITKEIYQNDVRERTNASQWGRTL